MGVRDADLPLGNHNRDATAIRLVERGLQPHWQRMNSHWEVLDQVRALSPAQSVALLLLPDSPEPPINTY